MRLRKQTKHLLAILVLLLIGLAYVQNEDVIKQSSPANATIEKPSAFIEGSEIKFYNEAGDAEFILSSQTALFFEHKNSALIKNPSIKLLQENNRYTTLQANSATYDTESEQLTLTENVIIQLPSRNDQDVPITLETNELFLDKQTRFISTDQAVTISQGENKLSSIGLNAWIDEKKIKLLSHVRGQYALEK